MHTYVYCYKCLSSIYMKIIANISDKEIHNLFREKLNEIRYYSIENNKKIDKLSKLIDKFVANKKIDDLKMNLELWHEIEKL